MQMVISRCETIEKAFFRLGFFLITDVGPIVDIQIGHFIEANQPINRVFMNMLHHPSVEFLRLSVIAQRPDGHLDNLHILGHLALP